jgi:Transposase
MEPLTGGYRGEACRSEYGGVEQRWLIVYSEEAEERARDSVEQKIQKQHEEEKKAFSKLTERTFACREDAEQALKAFESDLKASEFADKQVQRAPNFTLEESSSPGGKGNQLKETGEKWLLEGTLVPSEERKAKLLKRKSLFIVATNELDAEKLSAEEMLEGYKGQVQVERGPELHEGSPVYGVLLLFGERAADYGPAQGRDALPSGLFRAGAAHPRRASGPGPIVPRSERKPDSAPNGAMGI